MNNYAPDARALGHQPKHSQGRLFDHGELHRKQTRSERLAAFIAALEAHGSPVGSAAHEKTVDNYRKFLDELRGSLR